MLLAMAGMRIKNGKFLWFVLKVHKVSPELSVVVTVCTRNFRVWNSVMANNEIFMASGQSGWLKLN